MTLSWIIDDLQRLKSNAAFSPGDLVNWHDVHGRYRSGHVLRINTNLVKKDR